MSMLDIVNIKMIVVFFYSYYKLTSSKVWLKYIV